MCNLPKPISEKLNLSSRTIYENNDLIAEENAKLTSFFDSLIKDDSDESKAWAIALKFLLV